MSMTFAKTFCRDGENNYWQLVKSKGSEHEV
jgi:hypothetical protein